MKRNYNILIYLLLIALPACVEHPDEYTEYNICNNSGVDISFKAYSYYNNTLNRTESVFSDSCVLFKFIYEGGGGGNFSYCTSYYVYVFYDDTISVCHSVLEEYNQISRPINIEDNWTLEQISEFKWRYTYIFTEADYLEALALYDSTLVE